MGNTSKACSHFANYLGSIGTDNLISEILITEYSDGAASGIVVCSYCDAIYYFITVDWNKTLDKRIVALTHINGATTKSIHSFFGETPSEKVWVPRKIRNASENEILDSEIFFDGLKRVDHMVPCLLIAWTIPGHLILSTKQINSELAKITHSVLIENQTVSFDWFSYMDMVR